MSCEHRGHIGTAGREARGSLKKRYAYRALGDGYGRDR